MIDWLIQHYREQAPPAFFTAFRRKNQAVGRNIRSLLMRTLFA
ncbi:hypothetical protein VRC24_15230 [Pseudomonas poae]|nr:hypothetical protein [Pseudomonas poae]